MMQDNARLTELINAAYASEGSGQRQYEKTLDSLESKLVLLKNAWDRFVTGIINSNLIKFFIDLGTNILQTVNDITDGFGEVGAAITRITAVTGGLVAGGKLVNRTFGKVATVVGALQGLSGKGSAKPQGNAPEGNDGAGDNVNRPTSPKTSVLSKYVELFKAFKIGASAARESGAGFFKTIVAGLKAMWVANPVLAAVTAAIAALTVAWKAFIQPAIQRAKNRSLEGQIETLEKRLDSLKDKLKEATQSYNDFNSSSNSLKTLRNELNGLVSGTQEWAEKQEEYNTKVRELLELYPDLYRNAQYDAQGNLVISDEALQGKRAQLQAQQQVYSIVKSRNEAQSAKLEGQQKREVASENANVRLTDVGTISLDVNLVAAEQNAKSDGSVVYIPLSAYNEYTNYTQQGLSGQDRGIIDNQEYQLLNLEKTAEGYNSLQKQLDELKEKGIQYNISDNAGYDWFEPYIPDSNLNKEDNFVSLYSGNAFSLSLAADELSNFYNQIESNPDIGDIDKQNILSSIKTALEGLTLTVSKEDINPDDGGFFATYAQDSKNNSIRAMQYRDNFEAIQKEIEESTLNNYLQIADTVLAEKPRDENYSLSREYIANSLSQIDSSYQEVASQKYKENDEALKEWNDKAIAALSDMGMTIPFSSYLDTLKQYFGIVSGYVEGENGTVLEQVNADLKSDKLSLSGVLTDTFAVLDMPDIAEGLYKQYTDAWTQLESSENKKIQDFVSFVKKVEKETATTADYTSALNELPVNDFGIKEQRNFLITRGQNVEGLDDSQITDLFTVTINDYITEAFKQIRERITKLRISVSKTLLKTGKYSLTKIGAILNDMDEAVLNHLQSFANGINETTLSDSQKQITIDAAFVDGQYNQEAADKIFSAVKDVDFTNVIAGASALNKVLKSGDKNLVAWAENLKKVGDVSYDTSSQIKYLNTQLGTEDYEDVVKLLDSAAKAEDGIDVDTVAEMTEKCEDFGKMVEMSSLKTRTWVKILKELQAGTKVIDGLTDKILTAYDEIKLLDDSINDLHDTIENFDEGLDYAEGVDFLSERIERLEELTKELQFNSPAFKNNFIALFGEQSYQDFSNISSAKERKSYMDKALEQYKYYVLDEGGGFWEKATTKENAAKLQKQGITVGRDKEGNYTLDVGALTFEEAAQKIGEALKIGEIAAQSFLQTYLGHSPDMAGIFDQNSKNKFFTDFIGDNSKEFISQTEIDTIASLLEMPVEEVVNQLLTTAKDLKKKIQVIDWSDTKGTSFEGKAASEIDQGQLLTERLALTLVPEISIDKDSKYTQELIEKLGLAKDGTIDYDIAVNLLSNLGLDEDSIMALLDSLSSQSGKNLSKEIDVNVVTTDEKGNKAYSTEKTRVEADTVLGLLAGVEQSTSQVYTKDENGKIASTDDGVANIFAQALNEENQTFITSLEAKTTDFFTKLGESNAIFNSDLLKTLGEAYKPPVSEENSSEGENFDNSDTSIPSAQSSTTSAQESAVKEQDAPKEFSKILTSVESIENAAKQQAEKDLELTTFFKNFQTLQDKVDDGGTVFPAQEFIDFVKVNKDILQQNNIVSQQKYENIVSRSGQDFGPLNRLNRETVRQDYSQVAKEVEKLISSVVQKAAQENRSKVSSTSSSSSTTTSTVINKIQSGVKAVKATQEESTVKVVPEVDSKGEAEATKRLVKLTSPKTSTIRLNVSNLATVTRQINDLVKSKTIDVKVSTSASSSKGGGSPSLINRTTVSAYASGTPSAERGVALVGEEGPELRLTDGQAQIVGENGPEYVKLEAGDEIWDAKKTRQVAANSSKDIIPRFAKGTSTKATATSSTKKKTTGSAAFGTAGRDQANGTSSSSASDKDPYESSLDLFINFVKKLEYLNDQLSDLMDERDHILQRRTEAIQVGNLDEVIKAQKDLARIDEKIKAQYDDIIAENMAYAVDVKRELGALQNAINSFGGVLDSSGGHLLIHWDAYNALGDEAKEKVDDLISKWESYYDKVKECKEQIKEVAKYYDNLAKEYRQAHRDARDDFIQLIEDLAQAMEDADQKELEKRQDYYDELKKKDDDYLDALRKNVEKRRHLRDKADSYSDLASKQARLSLLQRDTSGVYANEIASLQKEIAEAQQDLADTEIDDILDKMQEDYDAQHEFYEKQITLMSDVIKELKENGEYNQRAEDLLRNNPEEAIRLLTTANPDYLSLSETQREKRLEEINSNMIEMTNYISKYYTSLADQMTQLAEAAMAQYQALNNMATTLAGGGRGNYDTTLKGDSSSSSSSSSNSGSKGNGGSTPTTPTTPTTPKPQQKWGFQFNGKTYTGLASQKEALSKINSLAEAWYASYVAKWSSGKVAPTQAEVSKVKKQKNTLINNAVNTVRSYLKSYSTGGIVDYTGIAQVHGTPDKPEAFLNAVDTKNFEVLKELLGSVLDNRKVGKIATYNQDKSVGDCTINVTVEGGISSDYDVERAIDLIKREVVSSSNYRNINLLNRRR